MVRLAAPMPAELTTGPQRSHLLGRLDRGHDLVDVRDVDVAEGAAELGGEGVALLVVEVGDDDLGATGGELAGGGLADARGAAGDDCRDSVDVHGRRAYAATPETGDRPARPPSTVKRATPNGTSATRRPRHRARRTDVSEDVVLSFGVGDRSAHLVRFPRAALRSCWVTRRRADTRPALRVTSVLRPVGQLAAASCLAELTSACVGFSGSSVSGCATSPTVGPNWSARGAGLSRSKP